MCVLCQKRNEADPAYLILLCGSHMATSDYFYGKAVMPVKPIYCTIDTKQSLTIVFSLTAFVRAFMTQITS